MENCIISTYYTTPDGHAVIRRSGKNYPHHRYVYCQHYNIPLSSIAGLVVRHKCDVPNCINPEHLELGTNDDNVADRVARNRSATGGTNGSAKLTATQVAEIRNNTVMSSRDLGKKYGVSHTQIQKIQRNKNWSTV